MKKFLLFSLLIILSGGSYAQFMQYPGQDEGKIAGGLGLTWIDNKPFYSFRFRPEVSFSKIGVGLDLNLEFSPDGKLRKENFNEFSDYLSIIRYVRYGYKQDPLYARLGALDYASLGHGSIVYMYNNSPSFDVRKVGLEFDLDFGKFGFESVYSNFGESGLAGLRGYIRPFKFTTLADVPVIGDFEVGATFAEDFNRYSGVTAARFDTVSRQLAITADNGRTKAMGFDVGLPVHLGDYVTLTPYFDYSKLIDYGSGTALGMMFRFEGMGLVSLGAKLERRFNGEHYIPSYFNSLYEIERFMADQQGNVRNGGKYISKAARLQAIGSVGNGYYGEMLVRVLNTFDILGSYQRLDADPTSGIMHLVTDISPKDGSYVARAGYDKSRIKDEKDLFKLDDRSYLYAEVGYKPMTYILVSIVYNWTFAPVRDNDNNVIDYVPQKKIEPRVSLVVPLDFSQNR